MKTIDSPIRQRYALLKDYGETKMNMSKNQTRKIRHILEEAFVDLTTQLANILAAREFKATRVDRHRAAQARAKRERRQNRHAKRMARYQAKKAARIAQTQVNQNFWAMFTAYVGGKSTAWTKRYAVGCATPDELKGGNMNQLNLNYQAMATLIANYTNRYGTADDIVELVETGVYTEDKLLTMFQEAKHGNAPKVGEAIEASEAAGSTEPEPVATKSREDKVKENVLASYDRSKHISIFRSMSEAERLEHFHEVFCKKVTAASILGDKAAEFSFAFNINGKMGMVFDELGEFSLDIELGPWFMVDFTCWTEHKDLGVEVHHGFWTDHSNKNMVALRVNKLAAYLEKGMAFDEAFVRAAVHPNSHGHILSGIIDPGTLRIGAQKLAKKSIEKGADPVEVATGIGAQAVADVLALQQWMLTNQLSSMMGGHYIGIIAIPSYDKSFTKENKLKTYNGYDKSIGSIVAGIMWKVDDKSFRMPVARGREVDVLKGWGSEWEREQSSTLSPEAIEAIKKREVDKLAEMAMNSTTPGEVGKISRTIEQMLSDDEVEIDIPGLGDTNPKQHHKPVLRWAIGAASPAEFEKEAEVSQEIVTEEEVIVTKKDQILDIMKMAQSVLMRVDAGKLESDVLEALKISPTMLKMASTDQARATVVQVIKTKAAVYSIKQASAVAKLIGMPGKLALAKQDATSVWRLADMFRVFPNFGFGLPEVDALLEAGKPAVLPIRWAESLELETLQYLYKGKVRVAIDTPEYHEEPTFDIPENWLEMAPVTQDDVLYLVKLLGGRVAKSKKSFQLWGVRGHLWNGSYILDNRATVRKSLILTRNSSQMVTADQAMYLLLSAADAALLRAIEQGHVKSKNMHAKTARGWIYLAMTSLMAFEGTYYADDMREIIEKGKFQALPFGVGPYGMELDRKLRLTKAELATKIFAAWSDVVAEPQGKFFIDFEALGLKKVSDVAMLETLKSRLSEEDYARFVEALEHGDALVAIPSMDDAKFLKRILLDKNACVEAVNQWTSRMTVNGHVSVGVKTNTLVMPTLVNEIVGWKGAIPTMLTRKEACAKFAFAGTKTIPGLCHKLTKDQVAAVKEALPKPGTKLHEGDLLKFEGMPLPVKVTKKKAGTVVSAEIERDEFGDAHWVISLSDEEASGQLKGRSVFKGLVNYPGEVYQAGGVSMETLRKSDLVVLCHDIAKMDLLVSEDGFKGAGKGNAQFRVRLAVDSLCELYGDAWDAMIRTLVDEKLLSSVEIEGEPVTTVEYDALEDYMGAYDKLVAEFEDACGREVLVWRRLPKVDYHTLARLYDADVAGAEKRMTWTGLPFTLTTTEIGEGFKGHNERLHFQSFTKREGLPEDDQAEEDDLFEESDRDTIYQIGQTTYGFACVNLVKVEYAPVSKSLTRVGSMLEVGYSAQATGKCPLLAQSLEMGGRKGLDSITHFLSLATIQKAEEKFLIGKGSTSQDILEKDDIQPILLTPEKVALIDQFEDMKKFFLDYATRELEDWDEKLVFVAENIHGKTIGFDKDVLLAFAHGTDIDGALATVRTLLGYAAQGHVDGFNAMVNKLKGLLTEILKEEGVYKRNLHRGSRTICAKRTSVFARCNKDHRRLFVNPFGEAARMLAKAFGCKVRELEGKVVCGYRGPQFIFIGLVVTFDCRVGGDELGVTSRVAALDQGDFDGDLYYVIAIADEKVAAELMRFNSYLYAYRIHRRGVNGLMPWHKGNLFDGSKNTWAKANLMLRSEIHKRGVKSIEHQTEYMPADSNRAHSLLVESTFGIGREWIGGDHLDAQALMMYVYEEQLAGYSPKWHTAATILNKPLDYKQGYDRDAKLAEFKGHAMSKLGLTSQLAEVWFSRYEAQQRYTRIESMPKATTWDSLGRLVAINKVKPGMSKEERTWLAWNIIAGATKRLSQGRCCLSKFSSLLSNLDHLVVKSFQDVVNEEDQVVTVPFQITVQELDAAGNLVNRTKTEVHSVTNQIARLAKKGNLPATRLQYFIAEVLPLLRRFNADNKPVVDSEADQ